MVGGGAVDGRRPSWGASGGWLLSLVVLGLSLYGLERRKSKHRRQRRTMPAKGGLNGGIEGVEAIGVQPGVVGGRIRQYTTAGGVPVVQNPEAIEFEARL